MKEDELRKSIRRQKLAKQVRRSICQGVNRLIILLLTQGLSVSQILVATALPVGTGTGTGTSDDEDDNASTPSGDNAERSLASTLGGSSESIPKLSSSTFLQAALDGPGSLSDKERGN